MLKQCSVIPLLLAFMATTFSRAVIVADFYANQDYIAKNLCENRDKPMMHCGGTCHLRKRLAREDNQDKNNPERRMENRNEVLFMEEQSAFLTAPFRTTGILPYSLIPTGTPVDRASAIFHPPGKGCIA
jgi:hypothetical protein